MQIFAINFILNYLSRKYDNDINDGGRGYSTKSQNYHWRPRSNTNDFVKKKRM